MKFLLSILFSLFFVTTFAQTNEYYLLHHSVLIDGQAPPTRPIVLAGNDQVINSPANTTVLSGTATGLIANYTWTQLTGTTVTIESPNAASTNIFGLTPGTYTFEFYARNIYGLSARDTVSVTLNPAVNIPPVANAGSNQTVLLPLDNILLVGHGYDADGNIVSYQWIKLSGSPSGGDMDTPTDSSTWIRNLQAGTYQYSFTVTDNNGESNTATVQVIVTAASNIPPQAFGNATPDVMTLPENSTILNGSGTDIDGTISSYSWAYLSGPLGSVIMNPTMATTSVTNLVEGVYQFKLTVTDNNGNTGEVVVKVTVNAPVPPANLTPVAKVSSDRTISAPTSTITIYGDSSYDPDGTISVYDWRKKSGPSGGTPSTPTTANTVVTGLGVGIYTFILTVTDNLGLKDSAVVTITVNAANQPPVAIVGNPITITLPQTSTTLFGHGTDPDGTVVSYLWTKKSGPSGGSITTPNDSTTTITGLQQGSYQYEFTVTDNLGLTGKNIITITVNHAINQPPTVSAGPDQTATLPTSITLTATASDPDGTIQSYSWVKVAGPSANIVNPTFVSTVVNGLSAGDYDFQVTVTDDSGAVAIDIVHVKINPAAGINDTIQFSNPNGKNYYISQYGNDANTGRSPQQAWKTIGKVNSSMASFNPGDSILFRTGLTYAGSIVMSRSGNSSFDITFSKYGAGAKPIISGLTPISGWSNVLPNIWEATIPLKSTVNILTINGYPFAVGRTPNTTYYRYQSATAKTITSSTIPSLIPSYVNAEIVIRKNGYVTEKNIVTSKSGSTITYTTTNSPLINGNTGATLSNNGVSGYGYFFQRDPSTLDIFGEWYYNVGTGKMRIFSTVNPSAYTIKASYLDTIFSLSNRTFITIEGLNIEGGGKYAIASVTGSNITIKNCYINNNTLGFYAWNTDDIKIEYNTFKNCFSNGTFISNLTGRKRVNFNYNTMDSTGQLVGMGAFPSTSNLKGVVIRTDTASINTYLNIIGNTVKNNGYSAIEFQGSNVIVRRNVIDTFITKMQDGGAIYTWVNNASVNNLNYKNRIVDSNFISNAIGDTAGAANRQTIGGYLDDQTLNVVFKDNVIWNIPEVGMAMNNPKNIVFTNNIIYNCGKAISILQKRFGPLTGNIVKKNILYQANNTQYTIFHSNYDTTFPVTITIRQSLQNMSFIDSNYISTLRTAGFQYWYSGNGTNYIFPAPLNLANWRTYTNHDLVTRTVDLSKGVLFLTNPTYLTKVVNLGVSVYSDHLGNVYSGSVSLAPFTGKILISQ